MSIRSRALLTSLVVALAAVPAAAQQPKAPPELPKGVPPFEVKAINANTWYGRFRFVNAAWLDMGDGVLLIDTTGFPEDAANLRAQVKETTKGKPIKWIVMTHLHADSNDGVRTFLPTDATIFVNERVARGVAASLSRSLPKGAKAPTFMGVSGRLSVASATRTVELLTPDGPAHTDNDLLVFDPASSVAFVGDLVITGSCPLMTDPSADPKAWLSTIALLQKLAPSILIPSRNDASPLAQNDLQLTADYLRRVSDLITEFKQKKYPDARVAGELRTRRIGDYCGLDFDTKNVMALFERADDNGVIHPRKPAPPKK